MKNIVFIFIIFSIVSSCRKTVYDNNIGLYNCTCQREGFIIDSIEIKFEPSNDNKNNIIIGNPNYKLFFSKYTKIYLYTEEKKFKSRNPNYVIEGEFISTQKVVFNYNNLICEGEKK